MSEKKPDSFYSTVIIFNSRHHFNDLMILNFLFHAQLADAVALNEININGFFHPGFTPMFLGNVRCTGRETHLVDCLHSEFDDYDCNSGIAGVICPPQGYCVLMLFQFYFQ